MNDIETLDDKLKVLTEYGYKESMVGMAIVGMELDIVQRCNKTIFGQRIRFSIKSISEFSIDKLKEFHRKLLIEIEKDFIKLLNNPKTF
jgi:hypothetical protein